jgi:thioredoxin 1
MTAMGVAEEYASAEPARAEIDAVDGPAVIEFGDACCGHCRRARPLIAAALGVHPAVRHIKIADGSGRPLGRSFRVKLWPTLVFLDHGKEVVRLVRPVEQQPIREALALIDPTEAPRT